MSTSRRRYKQPLPTFILHVWLLACFSQWTAFFLHLKGTACDVNRSMCYLLSATDGLWFSFNNIHIPQTTALDSLFNHRYLIVWFAFRQHSHTLDSRHQPHAAPPLNHPANPTEPTDICQLTPSSASIGSIRTVPPGGNKATDASLAPTGWYAWQHFRLQHPLARWWDRQIGQRRTRASFAKALHPNMDLLQQPPLHVGFLYLC